MNTTKSVPNDFQVQNGVTWIGGPTNELQRQHIPGYSGHVKGLFSQNIHGKNFARVTGECLNGRNPKGINPDIQQKYRTSYQTEFNKPDQRRNQLINTAEQLLAKLQITQKAVNQSLKQDYLKQPKTIQQVAPIDRIPVVGYQGYRPVYRAPIRQVKPVQPPRQVQLKQKQILRGMLQAESIDQQFIKRVGKNQPVVGYGGFLKGVKAQNDYGTSYQNLAKTSLKR